MSSSIRHLDDQEILPYTYHPDVFPLQKHSRSPHGPATPFTPDIVNSPEDVIMDDATSITPLQLVLEEEDDDDDELDLLKKASPLSEPKHGPLRSAIIQSTHVSELDHRLYSPNSGPKGSLEEMIHPRSNSLNTSLRGSSASRVISLDTREYMTEGSDRGSQPSPDVGTDARMDLTSNVQNPLSAHSTATKKRIVIFSSDPSAAPEPDYTFPNETPQHATPSLTKELPQRLHQFQPVFTLPSLKSINPEYKKSKASKRKRDKERESGKEGKKDDWTPLGLNKWAATVSANPVWKKVARAPKCLTTSEWTIAMSELRLVRALDRIETLKREGRWSFRQPKKQRNIGGVPKTHWDYVMDEMKWMRIDFREERKWKLALAYNISTDVLDWHAAGSNEARIAKGICVRWKRFADGSENQMVVESNAEHKPDDSELDVDIGNEQIQGKEGILLGVDYGSDDDDDDDDEHEEDDNDDEMDNNSQDIVDALEPGTSITYALDDADAKIESSPMNSQDLQPKLEQMEDTSALNNLDSSEYNESSLGNSIEENIKPSPSSGLKSTSNDPVLGSQPAPSSNPDVDTPASGLKSGRSNVYAPLRGTIAYSEDDMLFLDLEKFDVTRVDSLKNTLKDPPPPPAGLESIFPDLNTLDFNFPMQVLDGKKKLDRDDPSKRPDDFLYTRLYAAGNFMSSKPTLIGPLRPSRNWKGDQWSSLDDSAVAPESDTVVKHDDSASDLFDGRSNTGPSLTALQLQNALMRFRKRNDHIWTNGDDGLLKSLCDRYPNNWALISECFNSSRLSIPTDKRTPRDCLDRWREKWAPENRRGLETPNISNATPPPSSQMTTRKRLASVSISSNIPSSSTTAGEPRKKRRHALLLDTIRKAGKKRAEVLQKTQLAQRKAPGVHETHAQYSKLPKRTPAELSRAKAEKEASQIQELQQARKRQEEANRNNLLRSLNGQPAVVSQQTPQPQLAPQVASGIQRPTATSLPPQVVPQIRNQVNISQQQRTNTPTMAASRLTQQQLLQAQVRAAHQQQQQLAAQTTTGVVGVNGTLPGTSAHLSPPFVNRDGSLSVSPPHNSPRPPSAQAQGHGLPMQVPGNVGTRTYYLPNLTSVQGYTSEQLQTALRLTQQQAQQGFVFPRHLLAMASNVQGNVTYDPLPLTGDDHPSTHLYNAPSSPSSASFHTPHNQGDTGLDSAGFPLNPAQPRFLGTALYDDPAAPQIRNSYASTHTVTPGGNGSEYTGSVYALNDTLGAAPLSHGPYAGGYRDDPSDPLGDLPMSPMGPSQSRFMEEKRAAYAPPRAKSKRNVIILSVLAALILIIIGVVIAIYFAIIKPNNNNKTTGTHPSSSSSSSPPSATSTGKPTVAAIVTGGDGSQVTMDDGSTFTYKNSFGGYWYWDENDPFNNGARAQSWSPALNETFRYGIDKIRGTPALFEQYLSNPQPVVDEWTLSQAMRNDTANGGINQLENHYKTFIVRSALVFHQTVSHSDGHHLQTEQDFAAIAGAGLNYVRIPLGYWAIEVRDDEPFLAQTSWTYFLKAIKWARKYGLRINLDLHAVPGSQNGWNHSGRLGTVNFLNGPMGYANAQRTLDYIRIIAEFISQPQYNNVVTMFGILNEPQGTSIGQDNLATFYMEAYDIVRNAGGIGANNGPFISFHDGFFPRSSWAGMYPNADRMSIDTHPYLCFNTQNSNPMSSYSTTPCTSWGGLVNTSSTNFGLTTAGEFSNAVTDCGLYLNGVNLGTRYEGTYPGYTNVVGDCSTVTNWQSWSASDKSAIKNFAMASMDALQDYFFWTWKIGNSSVTGTVETPHWSYQLGLQHGWMPTDPRSAIGYCGNSNPWSPPLAAWQTGGTGAGNIPASVTSSLAWPPAAITNGGPIASLPAYTQTGTIVTLPVPTFTTTATAVAASSTGTADAGSGWANSADTSGMAVSIPSCSYLDPWVGPTASPPSPLCS
ncbi:hypothetical protein H0H93_011273 [Arthromyces matolae]|nr:hypothetical protein H0H93_011273 [Arthromyces matolae]